MNELKVWQCVVTGVVIAVLIVIGIIVLSTPRQIPIAEKCELCA